MTELLLAAAFPVVKFAPFTRHQEKRVGADWLWWWVDSKGEAFGMVVQAKRLKREASAWDIDFDYDLGRQRQNLLRAGLDLRVPPIYALYLGTVNARQGAFCRAPKHFEACVSCERATVSLAPAIVLASAVGAHDQEVSLMLDIALPLEDVLDPRVIAAPIWDRNLHLADTDLAEFLEGEQGGARRVAQLLFDRVCSNRWLSHSAAAEATVTRGTESVFRKLPDDTGHYGRPYYSEILDGLRWEAPDYVRDVLADQAVPSWLSNEFAGVAVFAC
ncbi:MAG: hypothetical protein KIT89_09385 [Microcella sp.]|uniref:hypothetical protein n=1 Tax=Microcella sp. TaxID=1913979 RepID=UPI0024CBD4EC|nr:hypothetical protein [Microcella sp.]UYN82920.1 MAG: hypothetical protein KIT89_09385 [Microcella sp.]